mgnify:CR=1 FL=1|tara:strand:+ start:28552 stop:29295 length:744 start_codon:yes stop_codon:yes gene_type:complete
MKSLSFILLCAGKGSRMGTKVPKVLNHFLGKEMVVHIFEVVRKLTPEEIVLVVPEDYKMFEILFGDQVTYCVQKKPLGTGDAVLQALKVLDRPNGSSKDVIVINGDMPNINYKVIQNLYIKHINEFNSMTITTSFVKEAFGYGRILRNINGQIEEIVEQNDLNYEQAKINEINAGLYAFNFDWIKNHILLINSQEFGEYQLTQLVKLAFLNQFKVGNVETDERIIAGVNTLGELKKLEQLISGVYSE